jgi:hypothetical protein
LSSLTVGSPVLDGSVESDGAIVMSGGHVIVGGVVSPNTVMVWLAVAELPASSVAVQVRVTEFPPLTGVVTSANVTTGDGSQASVTVGVVKTGNAGDTIVVGPGKGDIVGGVVSTTVMVWLAVAELPASSVAAQVQVSEYPLAKVIVLSTNVRVGDESRSSVAVGVVKPGSEGHCIVEGPGKGDIVGGVVSTTPALPARRLRRQLKRVSQVWIMSRIRSNCTCNLDLTIDDLSCRTTSYVATI